MKFNQLRDGAAEKFDVAQAVNFEDLAKQAQLQAHFSHLQSDCNNYLLNSLLMDKGQNFAVSFGAI